MAGLTPRGRDQAGWALAGSGDKLRRQLAVHAVRVAERQDGDAGRRQVGDLTVLDAHRRQLFGGLHQVVPGIDHEADVVEPGALRVEPVARRRDRTQSEERTARGLVDRPAVEVGLRLGDPRLVDAIGGIDGRRPAEDGVIEGLGPDDVGDGEADVGVPGTGDDGHARRVPGLPAINRYLGLVGCRGDRTSERHAAGRIRGFQNPVGQLRPHRRAVLRHAADLQYRRDKADRVRPDHHRRRRVPVPADLHLR